MSVGLEQRAKEFRAIIDNRIRKDEHGVFIIEASLARLFIAVLEMDAGIDTSDAIKVWSDYLREVKA